MRERGSGERGGVRGVEERLVGVDCIVLLVLVQSSVDGEDARRDDPLQFIEEPEKPNRKQLACLRRTGLVKLLHVMY